MVTLLGGTGDIAPQQIQSFLVADFYNHDSKTTDFVEGYEPVINTLFSFKNLVDDFYLKHLQKGALTVDICLLHPKNPDGSRPAGSRTIGTARLPLTKLLEKDTSFQAQTIVQETAHGGFLTVGKIFYKMKMRRPLDEALKWMYKSNAMKANTKALTKETQMLKPSNSSKLVVISVERAKNLRSKGSSVPQTAGSAHMLPFFSYDFYIHSHESAIG